MCVWAFWVLYICMYVCVRVFLCVYLSFCLHFILVPFSFCPCFYPLLPFSLPLPASNLSTAISSPSSTQDRLTCFPQRPSEGVSAARNVSNQRTDHIFFIASQFPIFFDNWEGEKRSGDWCEVCWGGVVRRWGEVRWGEVRFFPSSWINKWIWSFLLLVGVGALTY